MALTPAGLSTKAFPPVKGIPFWDQAALEKVDSSNNTPLNQTTKTSTAPGIWTAFPESPYEPWPEELSTWDTIKLGGMRAPGLARVTGGRGRRVPSMVIPGGSGATAQFLGEDAVQFTITLTLWTPKQWLWMQNFIKPLLPPPTALVKPVAVKVDYPGLALINVYDIYIIRVAIPRPDEYQRCHIEISCTEFLPFLDTGSGPIKPSSEPVLNSDGSVNILTRPPPPTPLLTSMGITG